MGLFTKLFGQCGKVRFTGETVCGETFDGKTYIECFGISNEKLEESLKKMVFVETGKRIKSLKITGFAEGMTD